MNQTVEIGRDKEAPYVAFGDDSKFGDVLAFAFFVIKRSDIHRMEKRLNRVKRRFGIPEGVVLHCSKLFHPHPREKAGLGHLSSEQARSIVGHLIHELNVLDCWVRYAFCRRREGEVLVPAEGEFSAIDNDKGMMALLAQTCMLPAVRDVGGVKGPSASLCEIYVAEEKTKVQFLGKESHRADRWTSGYSDVGAAPGGLLRLRPNLIPMTGHPMLQIADVLAYACSHALSHEPKSQFFTEQFSRIRLFTRSEFRPTEQVREPVPEGAYQEVANRIAAAINKDRRS
ncbi:hypothetical protein [Hydrogenophaga sp.]|uniref:hypothetical protein n=1 Tax=Hydrogenophaga sp. TaxID=1904254 RepID=UPI003F6F769B